jgi:hypothetical protein
MIELLQVHGRHVADAFYTSDSSGAKFELSYDSSCIAQFFFYSETKKN